jgi:iron complex transport system substrate-binding protein
MKKMALISIILLQLGFSLSADQSIIDMAGRSVILPDSSDIRRILTANPVASIFLYTVDPSRMVGWNTALSPEAKEQVIGGSAELPDLGVIYGNGKSASDEEILKNDPQFILLMGVENDSITSAANEISERLHLPVLVLYSDLEQISQAYSIMGKICGVSDRTSALSAYCDNVLSRAVSLSESIKEKDRKRVYYSLDSSGLKTYPAGNVSAGLIELCGGVNVIDLSYNKKFGTISIPFEELLIKNPEVILAGSYPSRAKRDGSIFDEGYWELLDAEVAVIPRDPFNFFDKPPSVNRIAGILWLQNVLYPDLVDYDVQIELNEFRSLFYGINE